MPFKIAICSNDSINTSLPYVSNYICKFDISASMLAFNVNFDKSNFFDSTVVSYYKYHHMGGSSSIRFAGACNPNATAPVIAQGLYATSFSNFMNCQYNSGYISVNLRVGDNIGLICNIISCYKYLGQISNYAGIDRPSRRCTEAATSTFVNFHAPISRDICDVLTYLFHVLNFQEFVQRHIFCINYVEYSNKEFVTLDL
jgi:hypothetical protein